jgi:hypothetical protein
MNDLDQANVRAKDKCLVLVHGGVEIMGGADKRFEGRMGKVEETLAILYISLSLCRRACCR